jgi:hypothetical protein
MVQVIHMHADVAKTALDRMQSGGGGGGNANDPFAKFGGKSR